MTPKPKDLYTVGTIATVLQLLKLPDGTVKVLVEGIQRGKVTVNIMKMRVFLLLDYELLTEVQPEESESEAVGASLLTQFEEYVKLNKKIPPEILTSLSGIEDPGRLSDTIAAHMSIKIEEKQKILEAVNIKQRLEITLAQLDAEIDLLQVEKRIQSNVKKQMEKSQREYYLNEKMKAIQKELGELDEGPVGEIEAVSKTH